MHNNGQSYLLPAPGEFWQYHSEMYAHTYKNVQQFDVIVVWVYKMQCVSTVTQHAANIKSFLHSLVCSNSRVCMMAAVLQLSVVRSILFFVTLVLWTDEQYDYGDVSHIFRPPSVLILITSIM